ncbi:uncharacterized protein LOC124327753 [Daphnia pulicaria]|uniref:uncharacterized protein LOC124327753 n=1 Tax=Daphnia pulicaria TaxID=35523 RepID=UPI001EEA65B4|nr:uncharacterized protein LOC124327753 [Daphnia pulicaria]
MRHFIFSYFVFVLATAALVSSETATKDRFLTSAGFSFTTFTLIKSTSIFTSTTIVTTTCTTSTSILATCTTGRRRRGLFYDESADQFRHRRAGLFYNDENVENKDGTAFLPVDEKLKTDSNPIDEVLSKSVSEPIVIPLEIQPGFSVPDGAERNRFLLSFGIATRTSLVFSTSTVSLTAICLSTTGFPLCGGVGK